MNDAMLFYERFISLLLYKSMRKINVINPLSNLRVTWGCSDPRTNNNGIY